jgi:subtilisin-like proprotein convertase family protein
MARRIWIFAIVALLAPAGALGDALRSTLGQGLIEVSHSVDVRLEDGLAKMRVRRVFANPGKRADEAVLDIDLPPGAAVTGLRIRARDRWYDADLIEAEEAARRYKELTGLGIARPKDPAILYWVWAGRVGLQVFPVLPGEVSTVEYTLTVPTRYAGGRYAAAYPRSSPGLAQPIVRVLPAWGDAMTAVVVDEKRVAPGAPVALGAPKEVEWAGEGAPDQGASYVVSRLEVRGAGVVTRAALDLAIEHSYKGDLRVELVTPGGEHVTVHDRTDGDKNDLRGTFPVPLPAGTPVQGMWALVVSDHAALDSGTLESWGLALERSEGKKVTAAASDTPRFIPDAPSGGDAGFAEIRVAPPAIREIAARLGRVVAADTKAFVRVEVDVAKELSALPRGPRVVFVVDASYTMGLAGIDAQLAMVDAYLAHVPDARAEVVLVRRRAERLFGAFRPAGEVHAALEGARAKGDLAPGNGSALDAGAALAAKILEDTNGPHRIVLATDELLRTAFTNDLAIHALSAAPADSIAHVVVMQNPSGELSLVRDDGDPLAAIPRRSGGILVKLDGVIGAAQKELVPAVLSLVRPVRIDNFRVVGADLSAGGDMPGAMDEGSGWRSMVAMPKAPTSLTLTGEIWSRRFERVVESRHAFDLSVAAWVFSEDDYHDLSREEQLRVAFRGRVVSPVTSYLAVEPGVRPSTIGIESHGAGMGLGSGFGSAGGSLGCGASRTPPDLAALLKESAGRCVAELHPPAGWSVALSVETTYDEVVDVAATGTAHPVRECLVEAAWALRLTGAFDRRHDRFEVTYP